MVDVKRSLTQLLVWLFAEHTSSSGPLSVVESCDWGPMSSSRVRAIPA